MRHITSFWSAVTLAVLGVVTSFGQEKPPLSIVSEPYRQKFVQYVDKRSISEKVLNLIGLTSQDVGRSFALIGGVSKYPNLPELDRELPAAAADIDELEDYLKNQEFFDEIVVLRDGDVTMENFEYFLQDYFPDRLRASPKSRFLFAYSGHGMAEGPQQNPTGYLLKSTARNFQDKLNSINMSVLRVYLDQVIDAGYQTLILINACHSGAFLSRRSFGGGNGTPPAGPFYIPKFGRAHAITSGGSNQLSWHDPNLGEGSVFFEKLFAGLGGQADMLHSGKGFITVDEISTYLREEVAVVTNQDQVPIPADLAPNRSLGGFFFLNRQKTVANGLVPDWNPSRASPFGIDAEQKTINAKRYYQSGQYDQAVPLFRSAAEAGNGEAAFYLAKLYMDGQGGLPKGEAEGREWFIKAADAGNSDSMYKLGDLYKNGGYSVGQNYGQALYWYQKAADAGNAWGMYDLGDLYKNGFGVVKNYKEARYWFLKARDAGNLDSMYGLGDLYKNGGPGVDRDYGQARCWYQKAADAGSAWGMYDLADLYKNGGPGVDHDYDLARIWYQRAVEKGDEPPKAMAEEALQRLPSNSK